MRLLLIDKDASAQAPLARQLADKGLRLKLATCARTARDVMAQVPHDIALVDLSAPDPQAQALLAERNAGQHIPMIALVPEAALAGRISDVLHFADDWVAKPVGLPELLARIRTVRERTKGGALRSLRTGALIVHPDAGQASHAGTPLALSQRELTALAVLVRHAGHVVPRAMLNATVYGAGVATTPNAIEAVLSRLRRKVRAVGCTARSDALRGIGWCLTDERMRR